MGKLRVHSQRRTNPNPPPAMPLYHLRFCLGLLLTVSACAAVGWSVAGEQADVAAATEVPATTTVAASPVDPATDRVASEESREFFEKQVRPILVARCFECHGPDVEKPEGKLRFNSREALVRGGETGPAIVPGTKKGLLIDAINYGETYQMPPKSRLPPAEIAILTRWVEQGASGLEHIPGRGADKEKSAAFDLQRRKAEHWCWQPIQDRAPPAVKQADWPQQPLDRFVLAKLEAEQLAPAAPADRHALVRRVYFDLIGLPPTADEAQAFIADSDPAALAKLVDRLLGSPQFGERWARHWLDLVRYSESRGHEFDYDTPNAWQYRDYVIRALNADLPYDQFVTEQIAGDLLDKPRLNPATQANESILGTGFWYLGEWVHSPVDIRADEVERQDNMLDVFGKTFCGLTIACARCHDHKFDAISQKDYYSLAGYLQSASYRQVAFESLENHRQISQQLDDLEKRYRPRLLQLTAESWRHRLRPLKQVAETLASVDFSDLTEHGRGQLAQAAREHELDDRLLAQWIADLQLSSKDDRDLLAPLARSLLSGSQASRQREQDADAKQMTNWKQALREAEQAVSPEQIILDYDRPGFDGWYADGYSFGLRPQAAGRPLLGLDAAQLIGLAPGRSTAIRDPALIGLKAAEQTQIEPGRINWPRAGLTLKTRTFTLTGEAVHYLVRGGGNVYAAVGSHWVNHGPLHEALVHQWKNDGGRPRWITHKLPSYQGQRAHLEFSPDGDENLEVLLVVQSPRVPAAMLDLPSAAVIQALDAAQELATSDRPASQPIVRSSLELTAIYERLFETTLTRLASDELLPKGKRAASADDLSPVWNWLIKHANLFPDAPAEQADQRPLEQLAASYLKERAELIGKIQKQSHAAPAMWQGSSDGEFLLIRGNSKTPGEKLPPRFLTALGGERLTELGPGNNRLALAQAMLAADNPLTARVMVNRVWHHLLGRGIVASVDNFGVLGERPANLELLDFLASDFRRDGWSLKRLIRRIMLSSSYQVSSVASNASQQRDPTNLLLQHARIRRLEAEPIRDQMLAISGRLNLAHFGRSVPVFLTPFMDGRGRPSESGPLDGDGRRSIYISVRRNFLSPMMMAFDMPAPSTCVGRRNLSNVPAQSLMLMNDPFVIGQARLWAAHALSEPRPSARVTQLYATALARAPTEAENLAAIEFVKSQAGNLGLSGDAWQTDVRPWADLCHVIFNMKEFIYLD